MNAMSFRYTPIPPFSGGMPLIDVTLSSANQRIQASALLDSGAELNVLPYELGKQLGFRWEEQRLPIPTGGFLQGTEAYAVLVNCRIASFPPRDLAFAWIRSDAVRLLLGQVNFFQNFDVCFYGSESRFELRAVEKRD